MLRQLHTRFAVLACVVVATVVHATAGGGAFGHWKGNWEGGGDGGRFEITLTNAGDVLGGKVDVGQASGDYTASFSAVTLQDGKLTARYDYTPDPQAEIVLEGRFDDAKASGTWSMVAKGNNEALFAGSWSVDKQQ